MSTSRFLQNSNNKAIKAEATPVEFPSGVDNIIINYLAGDIVSHSEKERNQFRLFNKTYKEVKYIDTNDPEIIHIATLFLRGEEEDINNALDLLKMKLAENPYYLCYRVVAYDPLGRPVKGTLLQIATIASDFDLLLGITEEKDMGLVERIVKLANLSHEEITDQLQVITSAEAKKTNRARNERILAAVQKFGKDIILKAKEYKGEDFKEFKKYCYDCIKELENALAPNKNEIISQGFIFDKAILFDTAKWFWKNIKLFGGWLSFQSDLFWTCGFGKLQTKLSSRDAQVVRAGIANLLNEGQIPARSLHNFYNPASNIGKSAYYGCTIAVCYAVAEELLCDSWRNCAEDFVVLQQDSIEKLTQAPTQNKCVIL